MYHVVTVAEMGNLISEVVRDEELVKGESLDFRLTVSLKGSRNFLIDIGELIRVVGRIFVGHAESRVGDVTEESAANLHGVHRL